MIRIELENKPSNIDDRTFLRRLVKGFKRNWIRRADRRTKKFKQLAKYDESGSIWGEISEFYRKLQNGKCAFCERLIRDVGGELEHFRPKNAVKEWPPSSWSSDKPERFQRIQDAFLSMNHPPMGQTFAKGYYMLAYEVQNYSIACRTCNGNLKLNYFPIAKSRHQGQDRQILPYQQTEKPYLIYPIGTLDSDPQTLFEFVGTMPVPISKDPLDFDSQRARITILFFHLEHDSTLLEERSMMIMLFYKYWKDQEMDMINTMLTGRAPHTNCCRSFKRLCDTNPILAKRIYEKAKAYYSSKNQ